MMAGLSIDIFNAGHGAHAVRIRLRELSERQSKRDSVDPSGAAESLKCLQIPRSPA
jgi:hypothetical protein